MKTIANNIGFIHYAFFILLLLGLITTSCDSFVEVDLPKSQLTTVTVFENYETANAALTDIYAKMRDQGILSGQTSGISNQLGNYTDEMDFFGSPGDLTLAFYSNGLLPSNTLVLDYWKYSYNQIYAANAVIEGSEASTVLTLVEKKQLRGESLFIRALLHFYLTNLYGKIPYINTIDYKKNSVVDKIPVKEVYDKIILDLQTSIELLTPQYTRAERTRPNVLVAKALLARVFLYQGSWAEAANTSSAVLNATKLFELENNLNLVFVKDSKETIWQLQPSISGKNTDEAATFIFFTSPPPSVALNIDLLNSFSEGDLRKNNWIGSITEGNSTWYYPYKYKQFNDTPTSQEYPIVFRLAEQYLIRAEARTQQGDLIGAKEDLNLIRERAGLSKTIAVSKQEILDAIDEERRWELFTEYGHRFFDLNRTGRIDTVLAGKKTGWNATDVLFPLPQTELNLNPNLLPQNNGY